MHSRIVILLMTVLWKADGAYRSNLYHQCCQEIGRKHAENDRHCVKMIVPKNIGNGTISDRRFCQELASVCCQETLNTVQCRAGIQLATSQMIKSSNSAFGSISCDASDNEFARECCDICKLTIIDLERSRNAQCDLNRFARSLRMSTFFNETFQQCCNQIQSKLYESINDDNDSGDGFRSSSYNKNINRNNKADNENYCTPNTCKLHQSCLNTANGPHCICHSGFQLDNRTGDCHDINECQLDVHDCPIYLRCDNTFGSYECIRVQGCGTGYTINADTDECEDIDECALNKHGCSSSTVCRNTVGSFNCETLECQPGEIARNGRCVSKCTTEQVYNTKLAICLPKNPCTNSICEQNCLSSETLNDRGEYYRCSCRDGFKVSPNNTYTCTDIDECHDPLDACSKYQMCVNAVGSFYCDCPQGYNRNSLKASCTDINECRSAYTCEENTNCINLLGEHACVRMDCPSNYHKKATDNSIICVHENANSTDSLTSFSSALEFDNISYLYYSFLSNQAQTPISFYAYRFTSSSWNNLHPQTSFMNTFDRNKHYQKVFFSLKFRNSSYENYFSLRHPRQNEAIVSMVQPIIGPKKNIIFDLIITGYRRGRLFRHQVVFNIHISKYELDQNQQFALHNTY